MLKRIRLLSISLPLIIILSGCASSSKTASTTMAAVDAGSPETYAATQAGEASASTTAASPAQDNGTVVIDPGNVVDSGKKIIYTVDMALEAQNAGKAINDIGNTAAALGGYVSDSSYNQYAATASGSITVRIPPEKLKEFTEHVGTVGEVLSSNMGSQDVTAQYVDVQSRLTNAQAQEAQLLGIMAKAVKIDDILSVRVELDNVQREIEELKGQIRMMDNQVGYSTVTITVTEPVPPPKAPEADKNSGLIAGWNASYIGQNVSKSFSNSISVTTIVFGVILTVLSFLLVPGLIITAIILIIVYSVKWHSKSKAKKPSAK